MNTYLLTAFYVFRNQENHPKDFNNNFVFIFNKPIITGRHIHISVTDNLSQI